MTGIVRLGKMLNGSGRILLILDVNGLDVINGTILKKTSPLPHLKMHKVYICTAK
jgi:hypothetical protein|tara:strand:+ start:63934 stop:64098 length:165 start_codon:yes stop_codon:yes gene_type:complete